MSANPDLARLRGQHAARIRVEAEQIQEFAGYILARLDKDGADSVGVYAAGIVGAGQRIMTAHATIEGIDVLAENGSHA
jgi:ribosomal protein L19